MEHVQSTEHSSVQRGSESKVLRFLTEEQKNKVALLKMDMKIPGWRRKIKDMESAIELKKKSILHV
jgi:hypothetical protein